ncbi:MAG TPA: NAD(+) synthase [Thermodesulfobacteriota bacterium]|nr:NAD(+) synthase [Thermodesulfobacteriota bacterium]
MRTGDEFFNLYNHGFVRVAVGVPEVRVADPAFNARQTIALMQEAVQREAALVVFPELGLSAYSCEDLFHQRALLDAVEAALGEVLEASRAWPLVAVVGLPVAVDHLLYNCAAVLARGRLLGVVPKTYLPNYREFYEARQFASGDAAVRQEIELCGQERVPFGSRLLFRAAADPFFTFHVEICEDLWVPIPPSCYAALAGATVLVNLSASNVTVGKADYRHQLVGQQSARCLAAYLYTAAGLGESTTDLAWDGQAVIYENGTLVAESQRFLYRPQLVVGELDLDRLAQERMRQSTFGQAARRYREALERFRSVPVPVELPRRGRRLLERVYERFPYVPADPRTRDQRCEEVYQIQVQGLATRLRAAGVSKAVIGVSGGLDSTQALLVCVRAMDVLGLPRSHVLAYTMPGFATSRRTLEQARRLMAALGCTAHELDIRPGALQMLRDIGHPVAEGKPVYDVTFENVQAGERTSRLFRLANRHGGLVVGTSDLSELALGWTTYGVGDHMAHYHVNASVPKTLIRYLIGWVARTGQLGPAASEVLREVLATASSPELVPGGEGDAEPVQRTEAVVGPFALQDFFLYYTLRYGYRPPKVAFLAYCAWADPDRGVWPDGAGAERVAYDIGQIKHWLGVFLHRFFKLSQFKRSALPNAPKVGSGGSLSPRGDWRAPSDAEAAAWLAQLELVPDRD